jgi:hypothetical protein
MADEVEGFRVTAYEPGVALSELCAKESVVEIGSLPILPTVGSIGKSPNALHPGPDMCVRLNPRVDESA